MHYLEICYWKSNYNR